MSAVWFTKGYQYTPDLEAYFARIKYTGSREVSVQVLKDIQLHHLLAVPFEALDVHLIGDVDLAPEVLEKKIVGDKRGGYCYQNNIFAYHVLRTMGFDVIPIAARTRWQKPTEVVMPPTHLVLKVNIDGVLWMFDVGFSSFGSLYPLEINTDREQPTPLETRRVVKTEEFYIHQMKFQDDVWHDVFVFTLNESYPFDWFVGSYWVANHPESFFVLNYIVSKPTLTCRYLLLNKTLKTSYPDGKTESREIATQSEYFEVLKEVFDMSFKEGVVLCPPGMTW